MGLAIHLHEHDEYDGQWRHVLAPLKDADLEDGAKVCASFEAEGRGEPDWDGGESDRRPTLEEWMERAAELGLEPYVATDRTTREFFERGLHRTMKVARPRAPTPEEEADVREQLRAMGLRFTDEAA